MKVKVPVRLFILLAMLVSIIPMRVQALAPSAAPPADMFQLPWEQGIAWYAYDGLDNGSRRPKTSPHYYGLGGAMDFAPRVNMKVGEDTSNDWVTAAAAGTVFQVSSCHIKIDHGNGWQTEYWHLDKIQVKLGDKVGRNQRLGTIHNNATQQVCLGNEYPGPHLHFIFRPKVTDTIFAGWTVNYNSLTNKTTFTKGGNTVGLLQPLMNVANLQVVSRGFIEWDTQYTGNIDPYRYERWSLILLEQTTFHITVTPTTPGLVPLIILLDGDGIEVARGNGTLDTTQPIGFYSVQIQPESGTGYYSMIATRDGGATATPSTTGTPGTATPTGTLPTPTGTLPTFTPTGTLPTATPTGTLPTATPTVTGTPPTETPTVTGTPFTETPTVTGTPFTETPTVTGTPPTFTPTGTLPTFTPTETQPTPTITGTLPTFTPTGTLPTFTSTPSETPVVTNTPIATETPIATNTPIASDTPVVTNTPIASDTPVVTNTPIASDTPSATNTPIASNTPLVTDTPIVTDTSTPIGTFTDTPSPSPTVITQTPVTHTPTYTSTPDGTAVTFTPTATVIGTFTNTPVWTQTAIPTPAGPYVLVDVVQSDLIIGQTSQVNVSLQNVPPQQYTSAEFTCSYNPAVISATNIAIADVFGADPASALSGPSNGQFILAIAGSNGRKATTNGTAFTFVVQGLQAGQSPVQCTALVSTGQGSLTPIAYIPDVVTVFTTAPSPTTVVPTTGFVIGQVNAHKPVTISLYHDGLVTIQVVQPDGSFNFPIAGGNYTIVASAEGYLNAQGTLSIINGQTVTMPTVTLPAGDIDGNGVIDQLDALTIGINYNASTPTAADLDNSGLIDVLDLELLASNYRLAGALNWE